MRRIFLLLFVPLLLFAQSIEEEIYTKVLHNLFKDKATILIYKDDPKAFPHFHSPTFQEVGDPKDADILLIAHEKSLKNLPNKPIFTNSYYLLQKYPHRIIGGFFWHKGRPNILLLTKTLHTYHIPLPKELEEFSDEEI